MSEPSSQSILLVVDMLSDYQFPDAERVLDAAEAAVETIVAARRAADRSGMPVVYANDVQGEWECSRRLACERALSGRRPDLVEPLLPRAHDAFMHKGQHSAFYGTPLAHLLHYEDVDEVILCGQVTEQCVLYTALDAHVRNYGITVLQDGVIAIDRDLGDAALRMMERNMGARIESAARWADERVTST